MKYKKTQEGEEEEELVDDEEDSDDDTVTSEDFQTPREHEERQPENEDYWAFSGWYLYRIHQTPRRTLYFPGEDCPIPLKYLDVMRATKTDLDSGIRTAHTLIHTWRAFATRGATTAD